MKEPNERDSPLVKDPVCLMKVDPAQALCQTRYQDRQFYFCSKWCKDRFLKNPEGYILRHEQL